jgi:DNA invertase Pin-like site-specific DNA recombinase
MEPTKKVALYARVSTALQSTGLETQVRVLRQYLEQNEIKDYQIYMDENVSGTKNSRPGLDQMMADMRSGTISTIVVPAFSRFARSTTHLLNALSEFKSKNVGFVSISERIDTSTPVGVAIFSILAAVSQLERDLIAERVRNGLANARAKGKRIGRAKLRDSELIRKLRRAGLSYRAIATIAKCSHGSVHAELLALKKEEKDKVEKILQEKKDKPIAEKQAIAAAKTSRPQQASPPESSGQSSTAVAVSSPPLLFPEVLGPESLT